MKAFVIVVLLFGLQAQAQDTLREQGAYGYSRYYVLHPENRFEYYFHHCTGTNYGKGTIEKRSSSWTFHFDSIPRIPSTYSFYTGTKRDSLEILLFHAKDSTPFQGEGSIIINRQHFLSGNRFVIPRNEQQSEELHVFFADIPLFFDISEIPMKQSLLTIFVGDSEDWISYESPHTERLHFKHGTLIYYWESRKVNEEKPWKKGRKVKRKVVFSKNGL